MIRRILSTLILGAMLISLAACANGNGNTDDTKDTDGDTTAAAVDPNLPAGIEKKNYNRDFTIFYPNHGTYPHYYFTDENDGEALSYAIYNREIKIEEHLGIDIIFHEANYNGDHSIAAIPRSIEQMVMSGEDLYQLVLTHCIRNTAVMITDGLLLDLNTVNTIDFDHDWWNHTSNDNLEVAGKTSQPPQKC